jgi:hypothetical protein
MDNIKELPILGIKRNNPQGTEDGACDEIINLRPKDGAWRAVGVKEKLYSDPGYDLIRLHKQDNIDNWIGYTASTKTVVHYDPSTLAVTQTVVVLTFEETLNEIKFLKRFMLVITTKNIYRFIYKENETTFVTEYINIDLTGIENWFNVQYSTEYIQEITSSELSEESAGTDGLLGKYLELVNTLSAESRMAGGIFLRYALRLYDGTYILHSSPVFHQLGDYTGYFKRTGAQQFRWIFNTNGDQAEIQLTGTSGTANITIETEDGVDTRSIGFSGPSLTTTASAFVAANFLDYSLNHHILLSSVGSKLIFATTSNSPMATPEINGATGNLSGDVTAENAFNKLNATAYFNDGIGSDNFNNLKDVIDSIVIFASKNEQFWDISEDFLKDKKFANWVPTEESIINLEDEFLISNGFKEDMHDSIAWYKIGEVQFSDLESSGPTEYNKEVELDLDDYYQDYATRETLPLDDFTHHELTGNAPYIYNNRLTLGNTLQTLATPFLETFEPSANPYIGTTSYIPDTDATIIAQIILDTSDGRKIVQQTITANVYKRATSSLYKAIFFKNSISYPDARAKEIVLYIDAGGGAYRELYRSNLKKSKFSNFSYLINETFDKTEPLDSATATRPLDNNFNSIYIEYRISTLTPADPRTVSNEIIDQNRVQISEVNNPFVFPSENSNQVGTGTIRAFGTNTEAMGVSQFGQYPLIVFTSVGRWVMEIGLGDVYILSIQPLDGEVVKDNYSTLDLAFGVAYITAEGLKISQGKQVLEISENVEGLQDVTFSDNLNFQYFINLNETVQMPVYVDKVEFLTYLTDAVIGYNKGNENNEIIVANPNYYYAYVYDLESKMWYKITDKYRMFIPNYPELYAVRDKRKGTGPLYSLSKNVVNISSEVAGSTQVMIVTRAISFDNPDRFKKLRRTFLRGFFNSTASKRVSMYIFSSDDLQTWEYITGNDQNTGTFKDIWVTHSRKSARFYIFVVTGDLAVSDSVINRINKFETEYALKMQGKLR